MAMQQTPARAAARVINLSPKTQNRKSRPKPQQAKPNRRVHVAAACVLAVALILLALMSLSHLAAGIALVTGAGPVVGWAMAVGVDASFVALELAVLAAPPDKRAAVSAYAAPAIVGSLAVSAAMNAFAFAAHASGLLIYPAAALGLAGFDLCPDEGRSDALD